MSILKLFLQGNRQKKNNVIVFAKSRHEVGDPVQVFDNGRLVQSGRVAQDMSDVKKYQGVKKRVGGKDVEFNSGVGYYRVELE